MTNQKTESKENQQNIYDAFCLHLKKKEAGLIKAKVRRLERHHILPIHAGGKKDGPCIWTLPKDHTLAHFYRWRVYKEQGDYVAFLMRSGHVLGPQQRGMLGGSANSPKQQAHRKRMGKILPSYASKGGLANSPKQQAARKHTGKLLSAYGSIAGSVNSPKQQAHRKQLGQRMHKHLEPYRSMAGKKGGAVNSPKQYAQRKQLGLKSQSDFVKQALSRTSIWAYRGKTVRIDLVRVPPQKSVSDLIDVLQNLTPEEKIVKKYFYKVYHRDRRQMYNWHFLALEL